MGCPEVKAIDFAGVSGPGGARPEKTGQLSGDPDLARGRASPEDSPVGNDANSPSTPPVVPAGTVAIDIGLPDRPVPPARRSRMSIGIDLGTSNSC
ncbi:MAG: hypothetical protein H6Q88_2440 [Anaeromyxobacteraceae bacterium]|nr:hypothetical protein [Anaeromyxobacteraceae bacterium]